MVNVYYPEISQSAQHVSTYFDRTPASTLSVLGTEFQEAAGAGARYTRAIADRIRSQAVDDEFLSADEYRASEFFREGQEVPADGIRLSVAKAKAESYDRQYARDLVLSRAKSGFGIGAGRIGASLLGSIFDPVNVGLAFTAPAAVGLNATARAATIAATAGIAQRFGPTTARVASGAAEAGLATLAFEAIAVPGSQILDEDYTLFDSFVNLTAGAILGGAVTGVGGKFSEVFRRAEPETVVQALRASVADLADGRSVTSAEPIINADPKIGPKIKARDEVIDREFRAGVSEIGEVAPLGARQRVRANQYPPIIRRAYQKKPKTITQFVKDAGRIDPNSEMSGDLRQRLEGGDFGVLKKGGVPLEDMALRAQEAGFFAGRTDTYGDRVTSQQLIDLLEADQGGGLVFSSVDQDAQDYLAAVKLADEVNELGINPKGMTDDDLLQEIEVRQNALTDQERLEIERSKGPGITRQEFDDEVARVQQAYTEQGDLEEFIHPQEEIDMMAKEYLRKTETDDARIAAIDAEINQLEAEVAALANNNVIDDETLRELAEWDAVVARADNMQEIADAGAYCVMRSTNV
jgi:hypothetical protein